jgi:hypothetical protein
VIDPNALKILEAAMDDAGQDCTEEDRMVFHRARKDSDAGARAKLATDPRFAPHVALRRRFRAVSVVANDAMRAARLGSKERRAQLQPLTDELVELVERNRSASPLVESFIADAEVVAAKVDAILNPPAAPPPTPPVQPVAPVVLPEPETPMQPEQPQLAPLAERTPPPVAAVPSAAPPEVKPDPKWAQLVDIAKLMHRGHHWAQGKDKEMRCVKRALTSQDITKHLDADKPFGLCPIRPGESVTRVALLDLDSHGGETTWPEMQRTAGTICNEARERGLVPIPFRSSGGKGIHLMFVWPEPQDAYSVRELLREVLAACGLKDGAKAGGVKAGWVEVFPKQDSVAEGKYGNMFVLPLTRQSIALDPTTLGEIAPADVKLVESTPVDKREKPARPERAAHETPEMARVWAAMRALPQQDYDYEHWRNIVFSIHSGTDGSSRRAEARADRPSRVARRAPRRCDGANDLVPRAARLQGSDRRAR